MPGCDSALVIAAAALAQAFCQRAIGPPSPQIFPGSDDAPPEACMVMQLVCRTSAVDNTLACQLAQAFGQWVTGRHSPQVLPGDAPQEACVPMSCFLPYSRLCTFEAAAHLITQKWFHGQKHAGGMSAKRMRPLKPA